MLNNGGPRYKRSKLERRMNSAVAWCVVFLVLMCFAGGLGSGLWLKSLDVHSNSPDSSSSSTPPIFLDNRTNYNSPGFEGFLTFWTFVIILQVSMHSSREMTLYCRFWNALLFLSRLSSRCRFMWPSSVPSWSKSTWFTKTWRCGTTPAIKGSSAEHSIFQRSWDKWVL